VVIVDVSWQRAVNAAKAAGLVRSTTETQLRNSSGS
jgi:hypothetical protein